LLNAYAEPLGNGKVVLRRSPGRRVFALSSQEGFRGCTEIGGTFYGAFSGKLMKTDSAGGTLEEVGDLAGTLPVYFARNNKAPTPDQVAISENGAFTFSASAVDADYPDPDIGQPNGVCFLGGYFVFTYGDGTARVSGLNDTSIDPLDFAKAESNPDTLYRPVPWGARLLLCGSDSLEDWANTGNADGFPFSYSTTIPIGLIGPNAIAGFEPGVNAGIIFGASDNTVRQLNGYTPTKISTPDLDKKIEDLADKSMLEAKCYKSGGHTFFELSCAEWTWTYNLNNQTWHEQESYLISRSRVMRTCYAFGKWLSGDTKTGNILEITAKSYRDVDDPLRFLCESAPVDKFPANQHVARVDLDMAKGVGVATGLDPNETDPTVWISWSDDGGRTWSTPLGRKLGRQGYSNHEIFAVDLGMTKSVGRRWRVVVTDPVYVGLMGGEQSDYEVAA
jgi:hypothetical protein